MESGARARRFQRRIGGGRGGRAKSYFALGSDTGGSIRQPAAYCGVVGLKPTYGLVSRFGLVAFASSLDQIGPLTKNVEDAAYVLQAIAGHDPMDSTSAERRTIPDYAAALDRRRRGLRIGVPKEYMGEGIDAGSEGRASEPRCKLFEALGADVGGSVHAPYGIRGGGLLSCSLSAEASSNLARFDGVRYGVRADKRGQPAGSVSRNPAAEGFGQEVKRRIMLGTYALSSGYYDAYYLKAQKVRTLIKQDFDKVFENVRPDRRTDGADDGIPDRRADRTIR